MHPQSDYAPTANKPTSGRTQPTLGPTKMPTPVVTHTRSQSVKQRLSHLTPSRPLLCLSVGVSVFEETLRAANLNPPFNGNIRPFKLIRPARLAESPCGRRRTLTVGTVTPRLKNDKNTVQGQQSASLAYPPHPPCQISLSQAMKLMTSASQRP